MRRVRPRVVVAGLLAALVAALAAVLWHQADLLRESTANYLRERLAAEFGAQFETRDLRGRWLPPGLSLGHVTFERTGEPWVLTAEDVRISLNPYAILFGRERLGRVVVERPRLFFRRAAQPPAPPPAPAAPPSAASPSRAADRARAALGRLGGFLRPPFPLRVLDVRDGRVEVVEPDGSRAVAEGIDVSVLVSRGAARVLLEVGGVSVERAGRLRRLGAADADLSVEEGRAVVRDLTLSGGPVSGALHGTVAYAGALALTGDLSARLDRLAELAGRPGALAGTARFSGAVAGTWLDPSASGTVSAQNLVVAGRRLPPARGRAAWRAGRLSWTQVRAEAGDGAVTAGGEADFSGASPRYRLEIEARGVDPARLGLLPAEAAGRVAGLSGTLRWEGAGGGGAATGRGVLEARFSLPAWPGEVVAAEADASLESGQLTVSSFRIAAGPVAASGAGTWSAPEGFTGTVGGAVEDLRRLFPASGVAIGGRGSFEGAIAWDARGPRFEGAARVAKGVLGPVGGIDAGARVALAGGSARLEGGTLAWPGGRGTCSGTLELAARRVDLAVEFAEFPAADAARLLGAPALPLAGSFSAQVRIGGTPAALEASAELASRKLRYRGLPLEVASMSATYADRRLVVSRLRLQRGTSELSFRGELSGERAVEGTFASPAFDLADFAPVPGVVLAGTLQGAVRGRLEAVQIEGTVRAGRLRYAGFDLKGGELSVAYGGGTAAIRGWIGAPENRLRAVLEPARDWRFESDLELAQFAPEMVRSGLGALPPALGRVLGRASFLAAGRVRASGRLRDVASIRADLWLDSLWLQASGKSIQNLAPVRISWRDGGLVVDDFRLAGEQYRFEARGGGGPAAGWDLHVAGTVDLAAFRDYWAEVEDVAGVGDLQLAVGGPWSEPQPEGSLVVRDAFVRVRSLPEAIEGLEGRLELRGRTLTATGLSGRIGGQAFRGEGSYRFGEDRLDAQVEGRLDLALFRGRLPAARELRGPLDVRLRLVGALAAPVFSGEVDVVDAELFLRPFPAKFTHLRGKVLLGLSRLEVRDVQGETGGGTARLSGVLDWSRPPARVDAELDGRGIQVSLGGALKIQGDLRLGLHGDFQDLRLAGEVRVLKARYQREFGEPAPKFAPAAGAEAAGGLPNLSRMKLDVKVTAADNVWIANRMAKIEAAAALTLGGTLGEPALGGEITAIQGEAYYLSRKFRLESATLSFVPAAPAPVLDLQASTSVGETQILFLMDGPLGKLSYHLTSLPALSQEDLISLLTIGETRTELERRGERASTAGAAAFTAEPLVNALGDEARSAMGLEVLQLEPVIGENQQVSARVTLGTHLSDRLFVSYSQNLGATEDQQVAVQYSLLDYLSVWGQELRQGIYSLDLVFRYALK